MPQLSAIPVPKSTERKIRKAFTKVLVNIKSEEEMERYIFDLMTPTERVMLAKRLAVASLLSKGYSYRDISEMLKVSTATVGRVSLWLRTAGDGYRLALKKTRVFDKKSI
jgi:TrpR-related protein YerC/YecD